MTSDCQSCYLNIYKIDFVDCGDFKRNIFNKIKSILISNNISALTNPIYKKYDWIYVITKQDTKNIYFINKGAQIFLNFVKGIFTVE